MDLLTPFRIADLFALKRQARRVKQWKNWTNKSKATEASCLWALISPRETTTWPQTNQSSRLTKVWPRTSILAFLLEASLQNRLRRTSKKFSNPSAPSFRSNLRRKCRLFPLHVSSIAAFSTSLFKVVSKQFAVYTSPECLETLQLPYNSGLVRLTRMQKESKEQGKSFWSRSTSSECKSTAAARKRSKTRKLKSQIARLLKASRKVRLSLIRKPKSRQFSNKRSNNNQRSSSSLNRLKLSLRYLCLRTSVWSWSSRFRMLRNVSKWSAIWSTPAFDLLLAKNSLAKSRVCWLRKRLRFISRGYLLIRSIWVRWLVRLRNFCFINSPSRTDSSVVISELYKPILILPSVMTAIINRCKVPKKSKHRCVSRKEKRLNDT